MEWYASGNVRLTETLKHPPPPTPTFQAPLPHIPFHTSIPTAPPFISRTTGNLRAPPLPPLLNPHDFENRRNGQTGEGQLEQLCTAVFAYRSHMGPVLAPSTHRKGSIHRHFSAPGELRNGVIAPCLLRPDILRGSPWGLYRPVHTCYG